MKKTIAAAALMLTAGIIPSAAAEKDYGTEKTTVEHADWVPGAVIYEVNLRQGTEGRDLKSMQRRLPALKDLGVDIVWLMPIHPISEKNRKGELGSYYAVADYKGVNPQFGTMEDIKEFVRTAHANGIKVVLDEVCNHSGCDNPWTVSNPDFYMKDEKGEMFGPFDWTDTYKLDYSNPAMREAMLDALKFWVSEVDIDGYRCDVAGQVPVDFWDTARKELQAIKPVFMLAEWSDPALTANAFDADYNWPMKDLFNAIAATQGVNAYAKEHDQKLPEKHADDIVTLLSQQNKQYPQGAFSMNMITNHDLNSWEGTEFDRLGPAVGAFAVLSYTLPGMPMLYTGQEVGFNHAFEFFKNDEVTPDYTPNEFTAFYEMLNSLKHNHPALNAGIVRPENAPGLNVAANLTVLPTDSRDILAFVREADDDKVIVVANLSNEATDLTFAAEAPAIGDMTNYFTGAPAELPSTLQPWQYIVLTR